MILNVVQLLTLVSQVSSANLARRNPPSASSLRSTGRTLRPNAEKPVVLVKLGPTTLATPAFCWSNIGPSTPDSTSVAPVILPPGYNASEKIDLGNNRRLDAAQGEETEVVPTAAPTYLSQPRVYVHKGHPDCFDFDWEVLPPHK